MEQKIRNRMNMWQEELVKSNSMPFMILSFQDIDGIEKVSMLSNIKTDEDRITALEGVLRAFKNQTEIEGE